MNAVLFIIGIGIVLAFILFDKNFDVKGAKTLREMLVSHEGIGLHFLLVAVAILVGWLIGKYIRK